MKTAWLHRYAICGMAFYFALVFCSFPTTEATSVLGGAIQGSRPPALVIAYSGIFAAVALPVFARAFGIGRLDRKLQVCACVLQYAGMAAIVALPLQNGVWHIFFGSFLLGSGNACAIFAWGALLTTFEEGDVEKTLLSVLLLTGTIIALAIGLLDSYYYIAIVTFPIVSLLCYLRTALPGKRAVSKTRTPVSQTSYPKHFAVGLAKTVLAFALVSFTWQMFAGTLGIEPSTKEILFAFGFILSALLIQLFTQYSPSIDLSLSTRWAFPIIAAGLLCELLDAPFLAPLACLAFACAHAFLETTMRMQAIRADQQANLPSPEIMGWGFAAISLGAVIGELAFLAAEPLFIDEKTIVVPALLVALVFASAFLSGNPERADEARSSRESCAIEIVDRARMMAERYALTKREHEILVFLLEGRSHPYIRDALYLSRSTVDTHVRHIYRKTNVNSKQELIDLSKAMSG